ncbi:MAG: SusF/SusE family outer membrane protein [Bacteroidaceae bacterium]|nr:SusF/SusE family outer membrane protein [Bacteroidaceae bacterium]
MKPHLLALEGFLFALLLVLPMHTRAALYIVGSAISTGWTRQPMTEQAEGIYTWEGWLFHGGELKFMTEVSDWGSHWGPSAAYATLSMGTQSIALHTSGDYKFRIDNIGLCKVQVDTNNKQIRITDSEGNLPEARLYPPCLYPIGTAVSTLFDDNNDYALHEDAPDAGTYSSLLTLSSGTLALHSKPYKKTLQARPIVPMQASGANVKLPKLRYQIETDKCSYMPGETVALTMSSVPPSGTRVRYRYLGDIIADTLLTSRKWTWTAPQEDFRGYMVEVYKGQGAGGEEQEATDNILATIAIDVSSDWTRFPRYGFVATFGSDKTLSKTKNEMKWLNRCHINGVQFQDWHYRHDWPLGGTREGGLWNTYKDIANRTIYTSAIKNYIKAQHERGMKSIFYNLCFGALDGWEELGIKPEWFVFKDKNHSQKDKHDLPDSWKSDIYVVNPGNEGWQAYLAERNDEVYSFLDFDGYQIDQLGGRGSVYDYDGNSLNLRGGFASFINCMKNRHPDKRLVMNAVGQWGVSQIAESGKVDFFYSEVWGNQQGNSLTSGKGRFTNIKNVIDENLDKNPVLRSVLAAYMNYLTDNKDFNTPGVVMADAVMFALGGSHLELGGDHMLCSEYFPSNDMKWHSQIEDWMTRYYDFLTAYENLLRDPWTERTNVKANCSTVSINTWEPVANQVTMLAREVDGRQVIHLLNFTHEESATDVNDDYMLCWHDNMATRPWPQRFENLSIKFTGLSGMGKVRRIWAASPDYCGGAMQELTGYRYYSSSGTISLTLPSLQFWTMIVVEPETATTKDNTVYGPSSADESLVPGIPSSLASTTVSTRTWNLQIEDGTYEVHADIPAGTLTIKSDNDDAITLPLEDGQWSMVNDQWYDLNGRVLPPKGAGGSGQLPRGILISKDKKILRVCSQQKSTPPQLYRTE